MAVTAVLVRPVNRREYSLRLQSVSGGGASRGRGSLPIINGRHRRWLGRDCGKAALLKLVVPS
mgnify:CR=1 FL=1